MSVELVHTYSIGILLGRKICQVNTYQVDSGASWTKAITYKLLHTFTQEGFVLKVKEFNFVHLGSLGADSGQNAG